MYVGMAGLGVNVAKDLIDFHPFQGLYLPICSGYFQVINASGQVRDIDFFRQIARFKLL